MTTNVVLAPGVTLRVLPTDKFKTACFSINFLREHTRESAPLDALLPSVLLRATEKYPDIQKISMRLDEMYGATFGTLVRRKGDVKLTGFFADFIEDDFLPQGETVFHGMVDFAREVLLKPYLENGCFCRRYVEGEKQNLINAIDSALNDKRSYAVRKMLGIMCRDEAYGVPRLGYSEDVAPITAEQLWAHYKDVLETSEVEIFYAGRQSVETVAEAFKPLFCRENKEFSAVCTTVISEVREVKEISEVMDITQGKLVIGLRSGITGSDKEFASMLLLNAAYGAGMTSKLFNNVREKLSLCYYASSSFDKYNGVMIVSSGIAFENYELAKKAILDELEACKRGEITQEELDMAKNQIISSLKMAMDAPTRLDDYYIGMALIDCADIPELMAQVDSLGVKELAATAQRLKVDTIFFLKGEEA